MAPVVFGVEEETLGLMRGALQAVATLSGQALAEVDPELGANLMVFFFRDWDELLDVPDLDRLVEGLAPLVARLAQADASQYRLFRFDDAGAIRAAFVFLRMDAAMEALPADVLALGQAVQVALLWGDGAFEEISPLVAAPGRAVMLGPEAAAVIRAAYDPVMPAVASDASHALRLAARVGAVE